MTSLLIWFLIGNIITLMYSIYTRKFDAVNSIRTMRDILIFCVFMTFCWPLYVFYTPFVFQHIYGCIKKALHFNTLGELFTRDIKILFKEEN